jgi:hypothetical protein
MSNPRGCPFVGAPRHRVHDDDATNKDNDREINRFQIDLR